MAGDAGDNGIPKLSEGSGIIPHFYYDVIGRIVPGAYLLAGAYWLVARRGTISQLDISLSAIALLFLLASAYAVSFVSGPFSHFLFDWTRQFREADIPVYARAAFAGDDFKNLNVEQKSELCFYTLWLRAPQLAIISSRWDAEAFAARQFGTATIMLAALLGYRVAIGQSPDHVWGLSAVAIIVVLLCVFQFRYSRRKAILGRFIMFSRASAENAMSTGA